MDMIRFIWIQKHEIDLQIPYGDEEEGLFLTTLACKDPNTPTPRILGILAGAFVGGFVGASIVSSANSNRYRRRGWVIIIWTDILLYKAIGNPRTRKKLQWSKWCILRITRFERLKS